MIDRVLVVGAGIGGLAAAAALGQRDVDVDVVEIKPTNAVYGVGINQPANALRALKKLGVLDEIVAHGYVYDHVRFCDFRGNLLSDVPHGHDVGDVPANCALPRAELARILREAAERVGAQITYGRTVESFTQDGSEVNVTFDDGDTGTYSLVVAFDGIRSRMREQLFGTKFRPLSTGYGAWRVTVAKPPEVTCPANFQNYGNKAGFIPLSHDSMYLLGVTPAPPGQHYAPEELLPTLLGWLGDYDGIIADVRDTLTDQHDVVYGVMEQVFLPLPWHDGRILIAGDAAHACAPHFTQGAAMALEDAVVLADELADGRDDVAAALQRYESRRFPRAKLTQEKSLEILAGESRVTDAESLAAHARFCVDVVPGMVEQVDRFLNQPA